MGTNQKLQKVLDYMEQNLNETMSLQALSNMAGYSVPQFYRLFKQLTGDTVNEYLLRRKMSEAAIELKKTPYMDYGLSEDNYFVILLL